MVKATLHLGAYTAVLSAEAVKFGRTITGVDLGIGGFKDPMCVRCAPDGRLLIADTGNHRVVVTDSQYTVQFVLQTFSREGREDSLKEPNGVFVTPEGEIYEIGRASCRERV